MVGNSFGTLFKITTYGESHGAGIGVVIDGVPAGLEISREEIQKELDKRKPGQSQISTSRKENDEVEILSGIFENKTLGTSISLLVRNKDQNSRDYEELKNLYRPSHADFTYEAKYGNRDYRGGGRSSARETVARVAAGAIAKKILAKKCAASFLTFTSRVGDLQWEGDYQKIREKNIYQNAVCCADENLAKKMENLILQTKAVGDSLGGEITCIIKNVPVGLGEPVFDKLSANLAKAIMSISATRYFEIGSGRAGTYNKGSEENDEFDKKNSRIFTKTNNSGGIQGGISNGADIVFRVGFKPTATIMKSQSTVDKDGNQVEFTAKGRHDPCVIPRAVPIVEAMAAIVLADAYLLNFLAKI